MEKALLKNHEQKKCLFTKNKNVYSPSIKMYIHQAFAQIFMLIDFLCFPIPCMCSSH